jgi:DNA excision repair protein ERCC-4
MSDNAKMPLRIVVDSREQCPFRFEGYPVEVETGALASADYSLHGFTDRIGIERKSLPDLVACLGVERERFARELARLRGYDCAAVVVEATADDLRAGHFRAKLNPEAAWQSVLAFAQRYRIPFFWSDSRADAEETTFHLLRHYQHDRMRELKALSLAPTMTPQARPGHRTGNDTDQTPDTPQERTEGKANSTAPTATATGAGT